MVANKKHALYIQIWAPGAHILQPIQLHSKDLTQCLCKCESRIGLIPARVVGLIHLLHG